MRNKKQKKTLTLGYIKNPKHRPKYELDKIVVPEIVSDDSEIDFLESENKKSGEVNLPQAIFEKEEGEL